VGVAVAGLARLAIGAAHCATGQCRRLASTRLSSLLDLVRALCRELSTANPLWAAPRIHGEQQKSGLVVSQSTVAKYMRRHPRPLSHKWRTFLANHASQTMAADLFVVPTVTFRLLFVLVILAHTRRRIIDADVTAHPTAGWIAQQLRNVLPEHQAHGIPCMIGIARSPRSPPPLPACTSKPPGPHRARHGRTRTSSA
jgi:hypothetical protein